MPYKKEVYLKWSRSKIGLSKIMYKNQRTNGKRRGHGSPDYSYEEFSLWLFSDKNFSSIYSEWELSGFIKNKIPSADRIDDEIGYRLDNLKLTTWLKNKTRYERDRSDGIATNRNVPVVQISIDNEILAIYSSLGNAGIALGNKKRQSNIQSSCVGRLKTAYGYQWKYLSECRCKI